MCVVNYLTLNSFEGELYEDGRSLKEGKITFYDDLKIVLFVAFSNKKKQRATIKRIFEQLDEFKKYVYKIYKS